ncbi:type III pantothenate kinase [Spirochaetota bacterium]|nr:type III pantothenate kinase [Spirochaetota bacterium]
MYLTLDIGNSNIVGGIFSHKAGDYNVMHSFRLNTPSATTTDELALSIKSMLDHKRIEINDIKSAIFSSVVPSLNHNITKLMQLYFNIKIEIVTHKHFSTFIIHYKELEDLGLDRLVNIKAANTLFGSPCIVIDFGTAVTIDVLKQETEFIGGLILPGIAISLDALTKQTSQLPKVELKYPRKILGTSTKKGIQNGIYFLYKTAIETIITDIERNYFSAATGKNNPNSPPTVIVTGGLAPFITRQFTTPPKEVPFLTLIGLKMLLDDINK